MKNLDKITNKNPFKVPENYFEEVNRKIIASTTGAETEEKQKGLYRRLRPFLAAAASVCCINSFKLCSTENIPPSGNTAKMPEISFQEFSDSYLMILMFFPSKKLLILQLFMIKYLISAVRKLLIILYLKILI